MSGLVVTALGACSPVGLTAPATYAALRAGLSGLRQIGTHEVAGEHMDKEFAIGGRAPTEWYHGPVEEERWPGHERFGIDPPIPLTALVAPGVERVIELAVPAAREAMAEANLDRQSRRVGLYLGLGDDEPSAAVTLALTEALGLRFEHVRVHRRGRAAGLVALAEAMEDFSHGQIDAALVGGADSLIRAPVLHNLDARGIVRSADRPDGILAGEAAAFAWIEPARRAEARGCEPLAALVGAASADEETEREQPSQAVGLTRALRAARAAAGELLIPPLCVCDLNGDRYRAIEWMLAMSRTLGTLHGDLHVWHTADCLGDPGAASGLLSLGWAATALAKGYAPSTTAILWGASDGPARGSAVLRSTR